MFGAASGNPQPPGLVANHITPADCRVVINDANQFPLPVDVSMLASIGLPKYSSAHSSLFVAEDYDMMTVDPRRGFEPCWTEVLHILGIDNCANRVRRRGIGLVPKRDAKSTVPDADRGSVPCSVLIPLPAAQAEANLRDSIAQGNRKPSSAPVSQRQRGLESLMAPVARIATDVNRASTSGPYAMSERYSSALQQQQHQEEQLKLKPQHPTYDHAAQTIPRKPTTFLDMLASRAATLSRANIPELGPEDYGVESDITVPTGTGPNGTLYESARQSESRRRHGEEQQQQQHEQEYRDRRPEYDVADERGDAQNRVFEKNQHRQQESRFGQHDRDIQQEDDDRRESERGRRSSRFTTTHPRSGHDHGDDHQYRNDDNYDDGGEEEDYHHRRTTYQTPTMDLVRDRRHQHSDTRHDEPSPAKAVGFLDVTARLALSQSREHYFATCEMHKLRKIPFIVLDEEALCDITMINDAISSMKTTQKYKTKMKHIGIVTQLVSYAANFVNDITVGLPLVDESAIVASTDGELARHRTTQVASYFMDRYKKLEPEVEHTMRYHQEGDPNLFGTILVSLAEELVSATVERSICVVTGVKPGDGLDELKNVVQTAAISQSPPQGTSGSNQPETSNQQQRSGKYVEPPSPSVVGGTSTPPSARHHPAAPGVDGADVPRQPPKRSVLTKR